MSKSKGQIDLLISKAIRSAKSERELSAKGLSFGRWWKDVGEYEKAAKWITKYLTIYDKDAKAHRLLGDVYEKLDKIDSALLCYKNSIRVKSHQPDLLLKVTEMHVNPGPTQNAARAQVWFDKAAAALPNDPQIFKLKMELLFAQEALPSKLEETMLEELKKRPADPSLYVQYVTFLKDQERLDEAFAFVQKTDQNPTLSRAVERDLEWIQCIIDTCQEYAEKMCDNEVTVECIKANSLLLISVCRYIRICFEQEKYDEAMENLAMLDNTILSALSLDQESASDDANGWKAILNECKGQLYCLCALALIYRATKDEITWVEVTKLAGACYAMSLSFPMTDVSETWTTRPSGSATAKRLNVMGGLRLSQSAHMLHNLAATSRNQHEEENQVNEREWLQEVMDNFCAEEGQQRIFHHLFGVKYNSDTSMIYNDENFENASAQLMPEEDLTKFDRSAVLEADLQTWVWMGVQWRQNFGNSLDPFSWISAIFGGLQLATPASAKYGNVWNLCQLDVEAFIVGCVLYAEKGAAMWKSTKLNADKCILDTSSLPLPLCKSFITAKQSEWWNSACKLHYSNIKEKVFNKNQINAVLRHGIECIRGSGNHGMQLALITGLAKHFSSKAYAIDKSGLGTSSAAWLAYQSRAAHYWTLALPLLLDVTNRRTRHRTEPLDRLFPGTLSEPTLEEARSMLSEVYMCNGSLLVQEGDLRKALETYAKADTPHASFCEALIYKQLLDNLDKEERPLISSNNSKRKDAMLRKYTTRLEVTLNRLEQLPDEELLARAEALLHEHMEKSPSFIRGRTTEPKRLFEDTILQKQAQHQNDTVCSEVDDSLIPGPSRQSTPKNEASQDGVNIDAGSASKIAQSLTALTTVLSTMQINFHERLNKVEQASSPKSQKDNDNMESVISKLDKLTAIVSEMQERDEERHMRTQLEALHEQASRAQMGSPIGQSRTAQYVPNDGMTTLRQLQAFDRYQQSSLADVRSSMHSTSPFYNVQAAYQGYVPSAQSPSLGPPYQQQVGYANTPGIPPPYVQPRMMDPGAIQSPGTPPFNLRPQLIQPSASLPMSKEAADALSIRFQSSLRSEALSGSPRPVSPAQMSGMPVGPSLGQPTISQPATGGSETFLQGRFGPAQIGAALGDQQLFSPKLNTGIPQQPQHETVTPGTTQQPRLMPNTNLPQSATETRYMPPAQSHADNPVLKSLLASGPSVTPQQREPQIQYPVHIQFPDEDSQPSKNTGTWNFKFQTPEEMDKDNKKLEADEDADDAETSHNDTGPHFEPLVTLPEVEVVTGEEDEEEMFAERAKLFRYHENQWKERGLGIMKILKHKNTGKHRLLMRREQIFKICCNHIISKDQKLNVMQQSDRAWTWHAVDFSEETESQELFAIRFKSSEIAILFKENFEKGQKENIALSSGSPPKVISKPPLTRAPQPNTTTSPVAAAATPPKSLSSLFGGTSSGFTMPQQSPAALNLAARIAGTSPRQQETVKEPTAEESGDDSDEDAHNRTGDGPHFEPVIQLPEKVETKTGEEEEEVLFSHRGKLYRFADKQWKERGIGDIKILHNKELNKFRIVMRREQVLKLCANHYITTEMNLTPMSGSDRTWTWTAMDHSDPDSQPQQECLAIRFNATETAAEFAKCFKDSKEASKHKTKPAIAPSIRQPDKQSFGSSTSQSAAAAITVQSEQKTKDTDTSQVTASSNKGMLVQQKQAGSWSCPLCYSPNLASDVSCPCCGAPNPNAPKPAAPPKTSAFSTPQSGKFSFGLPSQTTATSFQFGIKSKDGATTGATSSVQPSNAAFSFGKPQTQTAPNTFQFGFKPKDDKSSGAGVSASKPASTGFQFTKPSNDEASQAQPSAGDFSFGNPPKTDSTAPSSNVNAGFSFGGKPTGGFSSATTSQPAAAKPGIFGFGSQQNSVFSFGAPAKSATTIDKPVNATEKSGIVSPPKFSFQKSTPTVSFGLPFGTPNGGQQQTSGTSVFGNQSSGTNIFGSIGSSGLPKPDLQATEQSPKPSFPDVGANEESDEYSEGTDSEEETTDDDDDDGKYEPHSERYRSPMSRQTEQEDVAASNYDDQDVICLGEVLPSVELQDKASALMLPKHFYNFVKPGENVDDSAPDTEDEANKKEAEIESKTEAETVPGFGFGFGNTSSSSNLFTELANANKSTGSGFAFGSKSGGWVGMGEQKPLFANLKDDDQTQEGDDLYNDEDTDNIHFEPVVQLPEKVDTSTGEEDEEELYSQRCKLYRFNKPTNEWKERGIGDIRILRHLNTGRIRIVMRREQILKVCANHYIKLGMTLNPNKTSDRAWTWNAVDHSEEGEPKPETFTAKFKTPEIANEFKEKFDACQTLLLDADPMTPYKANSMRDKELNEKAEKMKSELLFFKDKFSEPSKVDLNNTLTDESTPPQKPVATGTLTPLVEAHASRQKNAESSLQSPIFGSVAKPKSLFPTDGGFHFEPKKQGSQEEDEGSVREHTVSTSSDDPQAENSDIHFEPIVQLPDKVDLVTGEEDEQVLFANRAKLYGYHKEIKQWKERGVGDVKILQHLNTCKTRVIMRREQVFKVCLNHLIKSEIKLSFKDPNIANTLLWTARDYSNEEEPEGEVIQFALRFKLSETAVSFRDLWVESADASNSGTLIEPDASNINLSLVGSSATSPGPVAQSPESPVKPPTSSFSFANVPSPFADKKKSQDGPVEVAGFVFGQQNFGTISATPNQKFSFDTSKLSFTFGTPQTQSGENAQEDNFSTPSGTFGKPDVSKNLFNMDEGKSGELWSTPNQTFQLTSSQSPAPEQEDIQSKSSDSAAIPASSQIFGGIAAMKEYKPSPLATASNASKPGSALSFQSGVKFQFKPSTAPTEKTNNISDGEQSLTSDEDVIFVYEILPTDDQRRRAEELQLPKCFFLYENNEYPDYDEKLFDAEEERILKFIKDRDSGNLSSMVEKDIQKASGDNAVDSDSKSKEEKYSSGIASQESPSSSNLTSAKEAASTPLTSQLKSEGVFGSEALAQRGFGFSGSATASFSALASGVQTMGFKNDPNFQFPGAGQVMFQFQENNDAEEQEPSNYKCDAQFKPVLDELPPLIEVKTGEEGEEVIFKERCKLFRYDRDAKAFKERGVGEIKILRNDEYKLHRVVMRRDQVHKVCTNHVIGEKTTPTHHLGNTKACSYFIMDYTGESKEPVPEQIAIRFKTDDICKKYMDTIEEVKTDPKFS